MILKNYWLNFIVITAFLLGIHGTILYFQNLTLEWPLLSIHIFFFIISITGSTLLFKNLTRVQGFMQKFFGFTTLKLLVSFVLMALYILNFGKEQSISFVVSFVILYLIYTVFESAYFIKRFKDVSADLSTKPQ